MGGGERRNEGVGGNISCGATNTNGFCKIKYKI
jgi:hypothetical protein